jgi:hypothetical protein
MLNTTGPLIDRADCQVYGCPQTMAVCNWLAERLPGHPWADPALGGPEDWARELGVPLDRLTRLLVVEDALRAALTDARQGADRGGTMNPGVHKSP